ncbi:triosephosphate isomerase [Lathyrus oleraceus]|uniref:Triosephosphate isomerase n=1 Tax=Pisum sativum TaxID=3888 RepID=A0A9D4ZYU6_PEA|nr:triosephosphate isomerase [Pisum sativum]
MTLNLAWTLRLWSLKIVVSSCGHDGPFGSTCVKRLKSIGLIDTVPGMKALDMNTTEDTNVRHTREVVPGMIVTGMEVAEIDGAPRMGPTFGAMIISGQKAAHLALRALGLPNAVDSAGKIHPELVLTAADNAEVTDTQSLVISIEVLIARNNTVDSLYEVFFLLIA